MYDVNDFPINAIVFNSKLATLKILKYGSNSHQFGTSQIISMSSCCL